jgi:hypothetical protein
LAQQFILKLSAMNVYEIRFRQQLAACVFQLGAARLRFLNVSLIEENKAGAKQQREKTG